MKLQPGRILEVLTPRGNAYVQFVWRHPEYGDTIRVLPGFFDVRPTDLSQLVRQHAYFTFYPATAAVSQKLVAPVATLSIPAGYERPRRMRRPGVITRDGRVLTWVIEEEDGRELLRRTELTAEERRLPIASIWNHEMLIQMLCEEWSPEKEGLSVGPDRPPEPLATNAKPEMGKLFEVSHYLYFPSRAHANAASAELIVLGFAASVQRSAEDKTWLVLASHRVPPDGIDETENLLTRIAKTHSGTYDGRETKVVS